MFLDFGTLAETRRKSKTYVTTKDTKLHEERLKDIHG